MAKFYTIILLFFSFHSLAQNVGVGTDQPTNRLHVVAVADPLRIEGLQSGSLTDSIVTVDSSGVFKKRSNTFSGWSVNGNSGTSPGVNFLGTIDNKPFLIRTNNQPSALIDPVISSRNNAFGNQTFTTGVTGSGNNAVGFHALGNLTSGNSNTAFGDSTGFTISSGSDNVALGSRALRSAGSAGGNVAIGSGALKTNLAAENIAVGKDAATGNIGGGNILAIGTSALLNNKISSTQTAIGNNALQQITGGLENIAIGYNAALSTTSASFNVLLGHYVLSSTSGASNNTIVGHNAGLAYTATGNTNNTFIGYQSALSQTGGIGNTYVGASVDIAGNSTVNNSIGIGQGVQITASNQVRVGNTAVTSIGGQVGWTTFSDARVKRNVQEDVPGLAFIEMLRPVTYYYDIQSLQKIQGGKIQDDASNNVFSNTRFTGLIAQEVEVAAKKLGFDFSGVDKPINDYTPYGLRYAEFVVPMIKAMQEMKQIINKQQQQIDELKLLINAEKK